MDKHFDLDNCVIVTMETVLIFVTVMYEVYSLVVLGGPRPLCEKRRLSDHNNTYVIVGIIYFPKINFQGKVGKRPPAGSISRNKTDGNTSKTCPIEQSNQ